MIATASLLLLTFITGTFIYKSHKAEKTAQLIDQNKSSLIRPHSPSLGRADAPVVIVEFFDPACGTCQAFHPLVMSLLEANPDQVRLVLRYAPFHEGSDKIVAVLEAARKQDMFWEVLDVLMDTQDEWKPLQAAKVALVWEHLEGMDLDLDQMRTDMNDPEIALIMAQDIEDANKFNIDTTPEFFINGKPLPRFGSEPLKKMVDEAVKASSSQPPRVAR
ncbi:MAG: thioredoxin domain-containing protein [Rhodocyclaceae bacterium]|nr:thioredoxin domain-containing protein [Rhodocyclaceae bacterium]